MVAYPEVRAGWLQLVDKSFILDTRARTLYNEMQGLAKREKNFASMKAERFLDSLPSTIISYGEGLRQLSEERLERSHATPSDEAKSLWEILRRHYWAKQLADLQRLLVAGSQSEREAALRQFRKATQALAEIDGAQ